MGEGPDTDAPAGVLDAADEAASALGRAVAQLPGGDARPGQEAMCRAVAEAIESDGHVLVQAGTGTGKGLAYLVPAILSGRRTVVVTATLALQEQLVGKDLPFLAEHLGRPFRFTLLKGRSNYLCLARKAEMEERLDADTTLLAELDEWIARTGTGPTCPARFPTRRGSGSRSTRASARGGCAATSARRASQNRRGRAPARPTSWW
jgi:ATP-dependent DNA helicase DinG